MAYRYLWGNLFFPLSNLGSSKHSIRQFGFSNASTNLVGLGNDAVSVLRMPNV